jgi:hypothetical protein
LLYQLSYVGAERAKIASHDCGGKDKIGNYSNTNVSPISGGARLASDVAASKVLSAYPKTSVFCHT